MKSRTAKKYIPFFATFTIFLVVICVFFLTDCKYLLLGKSKAMAHIAATQTPTVREVPIHLSFTIDGRHSLTQYANVLLGSCENMNIYLFNTMPCTLFDETLDPPQRVGDDIQIYLTLDTKVEDGELHVPSFGILPQNDGDFFFLTDIRKQQPISLNQLEISVGEEKFYPDTLSVSFNDLHAPETMVLFNLFNNQPDKYQRLFVEEQSRFVTLYAQNIYVYTYSLSPLMNYILSRE